MAITDNLIFHLSLEEASGTRQDDVANYDFTQNGTVANTSGKIANAASFTGVAANFLSRASESALQPGPDFTYQCWFNPGAATQNSYATIAGKDDTGGERQWAVYIKPTHQWAFAVFDSASGLDFNDNVGSWSASTTYHLLFIYTSSDKLSRIYLNNSLHLTGATALTNGIKTNGTHPFEIGSRSLGGGTPNYQGWIDQVAYWQRALDSTERTWLYNSGSGRSYAEIAATLESLATVMWDDLFPKPFLRTPLKAGRLR